MRSRFAVTAITLMCLVLLTLSLPHVSALSGTIRDQEGVPIAGAQVMLTSDTRYLNKTLSSQDGVFDIHNEFESGDCQRGFCASGVSERISSGAQPADG